ncbi:hypothetical protein [Myxococcus sp. RHSTA-1-4]|uniref:hypothetical protein n=1 Tax=Myxococcus sp. RHSTA-1-4 TaxID=2874601 RepID=UPI001CC09B9F|nr:hypothetical protein [Myxococcus sp. RHSTA-1-4]MBZ4415896.1 hypothetical protein [Myxococcus sp. RHSTA-1-4]
MADETKSREPAYWQDLLATFLLSLAAVGSAYSAWQSSRWGGVQAYHYASASASRVEAVRAFSNANVQMSYDASTFVQLVLAGLQGEQRTARLVGERFLREEFRPVALEWAAMKPLENPGAPPNPFEMKSYTNAQFQEGLRLERLAAQQLDEARRANQHADDYILTAVFFALGLFFGGLATKLRDQRLITVLLTLGVLGSLLGLRYLFVLPFH